MAMGLNVPPVIAGITAFGLAVIFACFMAFRDQYLKVLELTRPALRGYIVSVGIGNTSRGAGITVLLQLTNIGPPTIVDGFIAIVGSHQFPTLHLPPNSTFSDEAGNVAKIDPADMLYEKLVTPIPEGGRVSGFLFFIAKGIASSDLTHSKRPDITVRFRDASLKEYSTASVGPGQAEPLYEPGVRDPFIALYSYNSRETPDPKREALKDRRRRNDFADRLAIVMDNGRALADFFAQGTPAPTEEEIGRWADSVYLEFTRSPLRNIYIARFNAADDVLLKLPTEGPQDATRKYNRIMSKVRMLEQFIKELTQLQ
jgi:hypothetical protein